MFTATDVKVGNGSKYQSAGISEKVVITDVILNENEVYKTKSLTLKTLNENNQEGQSKRLSLNDELKEGNKTTGWKVSAKSLLNIIMSSTGKTLEEAQAVLEAKDEAQLVQNLKSTILNKPFRGLFSSREYQPGKFAIELYTTEPVGGSRLVWDPNNQYYVSRLPKADSAVPSAEAKKTDDLPF
jgi:phosphotransferase system HPr-like phosphotransfer protein